MRFDQARAAECSEVHRMAAARAGIPGVQHELRQIGRHQITEEACQHFDEMSNYGIGIASSVMDDAIMGHNRYMGSGMDAAFQGIQTTASIGTPVQFLQEWLPGFVEYITDIRQADKMIGLNTVGSWEDEETVLQELEPTGDARPYGDYTNVPYASWNVNYTRRTIVRFELGIRVGRLEEARAARQRVASGTAKRNSAAKQLEIARNRVAFNGYNAGANLTYGILNDPNLPAYQNVAAENGQTTWAQKTYQGIVRDLITAFALLNLQSGGNIDPMEVPITLAIPVGHYQYLTTTTDLGYSVLKWIKENYPTMRILQVPELTNANGNQEVFYMYADGVPDSGTDDSMTWSHDVPIKFYMLGVDIQSKAYLEDYSNATAGARLKRPYALVRYTGI